MLDYEDLFGMPLFGLDAQAKKELYERWLTDLRRYHIQNCLPYARLVHVVGDDLALPVRLFKEYDFRSVEEEDVVKTMTSSGTTGQSRSRIFLDKATSSRQTKALSRIVANFIGTSKRVPMLIIDAPGTVKNRSMFSARTAGVRGFSMFGRDVTFALDDDMQLDLDSVCDFEKRHAGERVMLFGFTFMIWKHFVKELESIDIHLNLEGILLHGGGWKKLIKEAVSPEEFKRRIYEVSGIAEVSDYYGMVEQTGSIFMECEFGHLHASIFSDVEIVDPITLESLPFGMRGLIKSISLLPTSYPGHVLLTEDEGTIIGIDDCLCGRKGKYFKVHGRLPGAEIRGCSDTYGG